MLRSILPVADDPEIMLKLLEQTAEKLKIEIRYDSIYSDDDQSLSEGGLCRIKGRTVLIVNSGLTTEQRCLVISRNLKTLNLDNIFIPPLIRQIFDTDNFDNDK